MHLVGETATGKNVIELITKHSADLLIIDPVLPELSGVEIAKKLHEERPWLRMIALYQSGKPYLVDAMQKVGFNGCICKKSNSIGSFKLAVDSIMAGNAYYCAETCRVQNSIYNDASSFVMLLSAREREILSFVGKGHDNIEIGTKLKLSPATVQTHRRNLFRKLGIHDTPALMRYAIEQGFTNLDQNS